MSKVDDVFEPIGPPMIQEWGHSATFVRRAGSTYDSATGEISETETRIPVTIVIASLDITEETGLYQANDVKILIDPRQLSFEYITTEDYFEVPTPGSSDDPQVMKVIEPKTYRGEKPVFHVVIARPQ